ncbi:histidine kinase [Nonomuraea polychroma]|uniref:histidine kinase n=1 Tax=Nonomuraea polychroma TaxID=46176 RepID=UPI003D8FBFE6
MVLLGGSEEERLRASGARGIDAAETERRRIERDLHDGAQQRLLSVAVDLGRAQASSMPIRRRPGCSSPRRTRAPRPPSRSCATWPEASIRPSSATAASTRRSRGWRRGRPSAWTCRSSWRSGRRPRWRASPASSSPSRWPTWPSTRPRRRRRCRCSGTVAA